MSSYILKLKPYNKPDIRINLFESNDKNEYLGNFNVEEIDIYSDLSYSAFIESVDAIEIEDIEFFINGNSENCIYKNGEIRFPEKNKNDYNKRIFLDCYGFAEISIVLKPFNQELILLKSNLIPILVKKGNLNDSIKHMANFVFENYPRLLFNGELKPKEFCNLKENGKKGLETHLILAEEIADVYEMYYGYFRVNSRFKTEEINVVDNFEKLQQVTSFTLQYISQHPEQLRQVIGQKGINMGKKTYQPVKTLTSQYVYSLDIYENRVVVNFLKMIICSLDSLLQQTREILKNFKSNERIDGEYIDSSYFVYYSNYTILSTNCIRIENLIKRFKTLWVEYSKCMNVSDFSINTPPKPSSIFITIPQYNKIFQRVHQWFNYGIYDFQAENYMLSFVKISTLYESYLLLKMISFFTSKGFSIISQSKCRYPISQRWQYKNTICDNTFCFSNSNIDITLYYQPVIFDNDKSKVNDIGLYRNNNISLNSDGEVERKGRYYVPDYIIKIFDGKTSKYIICDAKFSTIQTVKKYYVSNLAFKYLFSISGVKDTDLVVGLCILCGQTYSGENVESIYNRQLDNSIISPFAELIPIAEGIDNDSHIDRLSKILNL